MVDMYVPRKLKNPTKKELSRTITVLVLLAILSWVIVAALYYRQANERNTYRRAVLAGVVERVSPCDRMIDSVEVPWKPSGWSIECFDRIDNRHLKHSSQFTENWVVYGTSNRDLSLVSVSRLQAPHRLSRTIIHEWTHANQAENGNALVDFFWAQYVKKYTDPKLMYQSDPEEILAENVAKCATGDGGELLSGIPSIPCEKVYEYYPHYRWTMPIRMLIDPFEISEKQKLA